MLPCVTTDGEANLGIFFHSGDVNRNNLDMQNQRMGTVSICLTTAEVDIFCRLTWRMLGVLSDITRERRYGWTHGSGLAVALFL